MKSRATAEARAHALKLLEGGASIREAAAAAGVPSSTLHDWRKRGEPLYSPSSAPPTKGQIDEAAVTAEEEKSSTGTSDDPAMGMPGPTTPPGDPVAGQTRPGDLNRLAALVRYVNLVSNDVHHSVAREASRRIDPDFEISEEHHIRIRNALGKGDEPVRLSEKAKRTVAGNTGCMIALVPPKPVAAQMAALGTEPAEQFHITLAFLGSLEDFTADQLLELEEVLRRFAWSERPLPCSVSGTGRFVGASDAKDAWYASIDSPALSGFRERLMNALWAAGFYPSQLHGFTPHATLSYLAKDDETPSAEVPTPAFVVEAVTLAVGEDWTECPMRHRMSERLEFATIAPPSYVQEVYARWEMTASQMAALADEIYAMKLDAFTAGINDQLAAIGMPMIPRATDPEILDRLREASNSAAAGIRDTYNRDLAGEVYTRYVELQATLGRQTSTYQLDAVVQQWLDRRSGWKSEQIAKYEYNQSYNAAVQAFVAFNGGVDLGQVQPQYAQCLKCQEMVAMGTVPMDQLMALDLPPHPGCEHWIVPVWREDALREATSLWRAQAGDIGAVAAADEVA